MVLDPEVEVGGVEGECLSLEEVYSVGCVAHSGDRGALEEEAGHVIPSRSLLQHVDDEEGEEHCGDDDEPQSGSHCRVVEGA